MELLTILLAGLLSLLAPVGVIVDRIAQNTIRSQFKRVGQLQVRIDNVPSHQLLQGKIERVRIAGRSLQLKQQDVHITALEVETDAIDIATSSGELKLQQPLQAGVRIVLTQQDANQAIEQAIAAQLFNINVGTRNQRTEPAQRLTFVNPRIEFLGNNRARFQVEVAQGEDSPLAITVESGLSVKAGRQIQFIAPVAFVNGEKVPDQIFSEIATNFSQQLDLSTWERYGVQARILQLEMTPQKLEIATFVRVEPSFKLPKTLTMFSSSLKV